jgi:hypothetical protein
MKVKEKTMKINNCDLNEWLSTIDALRDNLCDFKNNANKLMQLNKSYNFHGIDNNILSTISEKYIFDDLIIDNGEIYKIVERLPQTDGEKHLGINHYIAQRIKFNLELDIVKFDIEEEYDAEEDMSIYMITPIVKE